MKAYPTASLIHLPFSLTPEPILKQDCERNATKRLLKYIRQLQTLNYRFILGARATDHIQHTEDSFSDANYASLHLHSTARSLEQGKLNTSCYLH